jgi:hypothetical protein
MSNAFTSDSVDPLSETDLRLFIELHLPAWQQACDANDSDLIVLHEASFGTSSDELFLFACAIKYAAAKGKHVHVATGRGRISQAPETFLPDAELGIVYREQTPLKQRTPGRRAGVKRANKK